MLYLTAPEDLAELLPGERKFRTTQVREWLYEHPTLTTGDWSNLPSALRYSLADQLWPFDVEIEQRADKGDTLELE